MSLEGSDKAELMRLVFGNFLENIKTSSNEK